MIRKISIYLSFFIAFSLVSQVLAQKPVAIIIKSKGDVSIKNTKTGKSTTAKRGVRLQNEDKITTGKSGRVAVKFLDDNSLIRVRPNSTCIINTKTEDNTVAKNIFVEVGTLFSKITKRNSRFSVTTPTSVASVKGTIFWTVQEFKGGTNYFGEEDPVSIENDAGSALMQEDETCFVASKNSKPVVRKQRPGEKPTFDSDDDLPDEFEKDFSLEICV